MMFVAGIVGVLAGLACAVYRALVGPTPFDRLLAANAIGTSAILVLALVGFVTGRPEFLDVGITYALLNMISVLAVLKFFRYGALGHVEDPDLEQDTR